MFKKNIILNIILIYVILFLIRLITLEPIDRNTFLKFINIFQKEPKRDLNVSIYKKLYFLFLGLQIPFRGKDFFSKFSEGALYNTYSNKEKRKNHDVDSKFFWYNLFKNNNIPHPKLILTKRNNKIQHYNRIVSNKNYIIKPIYGTLGKNVEKVQGSKINKKIKNLDNIIIQDMLRDCNTEKSRHFRYISLYNGNSFMLYEFKSSSSIVSNRGGGGIVSLCKYLKCNSFNKNEEKSINKIIKKLSNLHKTNFDYIFSIGWDVMLNCENNKVKAYCLEGNIRHCSWFYPDLLDQEIINSYKKKLINFKNK